MTQEHKPLYLLVRRLFPDFVNDEYPMLVTFFEKVFEYMDQDGGQYDIIANLLEYSDVDLTRKEFEDVFKTQYLQNFPEALVADLDLIVKNIRSFYQSKGTEDSFRFLFAALFNASVNFEYPKYNILRTSDGNWFTPEYLVLVDETGELPPQAVINVGDTWTDLQFNANSPPGTPATITRVSSAQSFVGIFQAGNNIRVTGSASNDGVYKVFSVTSTTVTLDSAETLINEGTNDVTALMEGTTNFNVSALIDNFITGVTTGAAAFVDGTKVLSNELNPAGQPWDYLGDGTAIGISVLEKEGAFQRGEQIIVGNVLVENGSFLDGLNFWSNSLASDLFTSVNEFGQLVIEQDPGRLTNKYLYQEIMVKEDTQYYIRFNFIGADSAETKVTVGYAPGTNELYDSGNLGTTQDTVLALVPATAAGKTSVYISIHNNMTLGNQKCTFDGISFVEYNASIQPLLFIANNGVTYTDLQFTARVGATLANITRVSSGVDFTTIFSAGDILTVSGSASNDGDYLIDTVAATQIDIDISQDLTDEGTADVTAVISEKGLIVGESQYADNSGFLSDAGMVLRDGDRYQDYSYVLLSSVSKNFYESIIKDLVHPSGFKLFGEVVFADNEFPDFTFPLKIVDEDFLGTREDFFLYESQLVSPLSTGFELNITGTTGDLADGGYQIEMITRLGFGDTWRDNELNREVRGVKVEDWEPLVVGDFETFATSRFGFIIPSEIDVTP